MRKNRFRLYNSSALGLKIMHSNYISNVYKELFVAGCKFVYNHLYLALINHTNIYHEIYPDLYFYNINTACYCYGSERCREMEQQ